MPSVPRTTTGACAGGRGGVPVDSPEVSVVSGQGELARDDGGEAAAEPDVGEQRRARFDFGMAHDRVPLFVSHAAERQVELPRRLRQQPLAEFDRFVELHRAQKVADLGARLAGAHERQPGRIGSRDRSR